MQPQPNMQHFNTFPGTSYPQNQLQHQVASVIPNQVMNNTGSMGKYQLQYGNQLMHNQSPGALISNYQPTTATQYMQGGPGQMLNYGHPVGIPITHSANSTGSMPIYQPQIQGNYQQQMVQGSQASMTNNFMNAAMQGMVEGAAQAVGQTLVLSILSGSDGGEGDGGGGGALET